MHKAEKPKETIKKMSPYYTELPNEVKFEKLVWKDVKTLKFDTDYGL